MCCLLLCVVAVVCGLLVIGAWRCHSLLYAVVRWCLTLVVGVAVRCAFFVADFCCGLL